MRTLGKWIIATENELRNIVVEAMPETVARRRANLVNQDLLRAAMAAEAHLGENPACAAHQLHRDAVREMLSEAIAAAVEDGSQ